MIMMELFGLLGAFFVFTSLMMKTMLPLRMVSLASNLSFVSYGLLSLKAGLFLQVFPILLLHSLLIPINIFRLVQIMRQHTKSKTTKPIINQPHVIKRTTQTAPILIDYQNAKSHNELTMNKKELIDSISETGSLSKQQATTAVDALIDTITQTLSSGDDLTLIGFGTFSVKDRAARTGRNPKTGEPLQIAASRVPHFKAGSKLKEEVASA